MKRIFIGLLTSIVLSSCFLEKENCDKMAEITLAEDYYLVLNKKPEKWSGEGRWFDQLGGYWNTGDTIIKKEGELFLEIRKKDVIHTSEWTCEGVFIDGVSVRDLGRIQKYGK